MLATLSISALGALVNGAIEEFQLPIKEVGKFKDKATALVKVQRLMDQYDFVLADGKLAKRPEQPGDAKLREELHEGLVEEIGQEKLDAVSLYKEVPVADKSTDTPKKEKAPKPPRLNKARTEGVNKTPKDTILASRVGSNQAILIDALQGGSTIGSATRHLNAETGKALSDSVVYSTIMYDLCTMKGYGIRTEKMNGEQLYANDHFVDADELGWGDKGAKSDAYNPEVTRFVYHLVLPAGVKDFPAHTARKTLTAEEKAAKPKREPKAKAAAAPAEGDSVGADEKAPGLE